MKNTIKTIYRNIKNFLVSILTYPLKIVKNIYLIFKEIYLFISYVKTINKLSDVLEKKGILRSRTSRFALVKGIELKPEILELETDPDNIKRILDGEVTPDLERFEISFVGKEMSKYNDIFMQNGILELIKTKANRFYKKSEKYGYLVEISFNYNHLKLYSILVTLFNTAILTIIILLIPYQYIISLIN
jgi:hypothetical protein